MERVGIQLDHQEGHGLMRIVCSVKWLPFYAFLYISKALQSLRGLTLAIMCDFSLSLCNSGWVYAVCYSLAFTLTCNMYIHPLPLDTGVAIATAFCPLQSDAINQSKGFTIAVCDIGTILYYALLVYSMSASMLTVSQS